MFSIEVYAGLCSGQVPNVPTWPGIELFLCLFTISIIIIFNLLWLLSAQRWDLTYLVSFGVTPSQAFTDVWPYR